VTGYCHRPDPGHLNTAQHGRDAGVGEDGIEEGGVLAVAIANDVPDPAFGVVQIHGEVAGGLRDPGGGRVGGGAENSDPAAGVLNGGQYVETGTGQRHRLDEVGGDDGLGLGA
jgi:hypothetical protein